MQMKIRAVSTTSFLLPESLLTILNDPATSFMRLAHVCSILLHLDRSQLVRWADVTFPNCLAVMEQAVEDETEDSVSENDLLSAMFKSGECVLVIPNLADLRLCALLRTIVQESKQPRKLFHPQHFC